MWNPKRKDELSQYKLDKGIKLDKLKTSCGKHSVEELASALKLSTTTIIKWQKIYEG